MLTETEELVELDAPDSDWEYPEELLDQWEAEFDEMRVKLATGEMKIHQSLQEALAEHRAKRAIHGV